MKPPPGALKRLTEWLGRDIEPTAIERLERYAGWLVDEAITIGGIGPGEAERLWDRHIIDSLLFAWGLQAGMSVLDIGSGVGLPGVPLAIIHNGPVVLLDRSGRRIDALHRVVALLGLDAAIVHADVGEYSVRHDRLVLRASLALPAARANLARLCTSHGEALFGLGRGEDPEAVRNWRTGTPPTDIAESLIHVPSQVLDSPAWLLRMAPL